MDSANASRTVSHPRLGTGQLLKTYMGGYQWEVVFANGSRYRLPSYQFAPELIAANTPTSNNTFRPIIQPPQTDQFRNRQTLEALRMGIVPVQNVEDLTIGLEIEQASLERALLRTQEHGGDALALIADYGFGKSHFVELTARKALKQNFLVALASLDVVEVPPSKGREIYRALVTSIRYPDHDERGLKPLLEGIQANPAAVREFVARKPIADCPLCAALEALADCPDQAAHDDLINWISAQIKPTAEMKRCLKKPPALYAIGEVARQYAYLLTAISALAVSAGYSGLAVLIDESEHYSLLKGTQKERAAAFFQATIYAAVGPANSRVDITAIQHHARPDYPIQFSEDLRLFFLFASTESDTRMPIEAWLSPSQIVRLDDRFLKDDIDKFLKMVLRYHSVAYQYVPARDRYETLVRNAASALSRVLSQHRFNIRELIRLAVTLCDLMFLHPDYAPDDLYGELARGLGVT